MIRKWVLCIVVGFAIPVLVHAEIWQGVPVVDSQCDTKVKDNPDEHTASCALACAKNGYGIITSEGTCLKFDKSGNAKVVDLLKQNRKKDHLRVTVDGERNGDTIKVNSVSLN